MNNEVKIARVMNEVNSPMTVYEMTPEYHGVNVIATIEVSEYKELLIKSGENIAEYNEVLDRNKDCKNMILPGTIGKHGVIISKVFGHFINEDIEEYLENEGYVIVNLGGMFNVDTDDRKTEIKDDEN
jgi:hypothetical protein